MSIKMVEPGRSAIFVRGHIYSKKRITRKFKCLCRKKCGKEGKEG